MNIDLHSALRWKNPPDSYFFTCILDEVISGYVESLTENEKKLLLENPNDFDSLVSGDWQEQLLLKLTTSPGCILIKSGESFSDETLRCIYALYCRSIGLLNNRYGYFFDVVDQGLDYTKQAIPVSKTRSSTGYHTDSTAKEYLPDIVGLLCLHPGAVGGDSLLTNAANLYDHLLQNHPDVLELMQKPIIRDVITPGTTNSVESIKENAFPIFSFPIEGFTFRYMRYWIESAYQKTGQTLPTKLIQGLEETDHYFSNPDNYLQFKLERGDILFLNNRFICHNRTAFENNSSKTLQRTLVRTWINSEKSEVLK